MNTEKLTHEIDTRIQSGENVSQNTQLKTALNQLMKKGLIDNSNIDETFKDSEKLSKMIKAYENILKAEKKKALRTPLTRARNLAALYVDLFSFNSEGMTFQDALKAAMHKKYEFVHDDMSRSESNIKKSRKYSKYHTHQSIALELMHEGQKASPELWPKLTASFVSSFLRYTRGLSTPSVAVPIERIMFFEDFFNVPRGAFVDKLTLKKPKKSKKSSSNTNDKKKIIRLKNLSTDLLLFLDKYSAYRILGKQPEIIHIPAAFKGHEKFLRVSEKNKVTWTVSASSRVCASKETLRQSLTSFMTFCTNDLEMAPDSITLAHLTDISILEQWKNKVIKNGKGGRACKEILNTIKNSSSERGYFRLCGDLGNRTIKEYYLELNRISAISREWSKSAASLGVEKKDPKENVRFLLDMSTTEMWKTIDLGIQWSFDNAKNLILNPLPDNIEKAYHTTQSMMIFYLSRVTAIREGNWTDLILNMNHSDFSYDTASLTWYKNKQCFRVYVPVHLLKNKSRKKIRPIDCYYPKSFNEIIKKSLFYRQKYIDVVVNDNKQRNDKPRKLICKKKFSSEVADLDSSLEEKRNTVFGERFKSNTEKVFDTVIPNVEQNGVNIHATRHLTATWYLNKHPDDFAGLCLLLHDSLKVIMRDYAEINEKIAQERIIKSAEEEGSVLIL